MSGMNRGLGLASILGASFLVACGGGDTPPPTTPTAAPPTSAPAAASAAPATHNIPQGGKVGSVKDAERRASTAIAADSLDVHSASAAPPKTSKEIYKAVAPATVIVRVPRGMGSGIVISKDGWVLTNHHVIARGESKDFKKKATILLGSISKDTGGMERSKKEYEADVYVADKLRDIALLKIKDPPKNLPSIKLAKQNPSPGDKVISIGHAGAGMLWAIKSCEISALGKMSEHLATLASFKNDKNGQKARDAFKKRVDKLNLGMVIQTTCNILPGDSGGPLVNNRGELVGLNAFMRRDRRVGGALSFHVHIGEVRKVAKDRPAKPRSLVPDPWKEGGANMKLDDVDLDGRIDMMSLKGRRPCRFCPVSSSAIFIDADESSYTSGKVPPLNDIYEKKQFEAEAIALHVNRDLHVWYDTDNDGKHDVLLLDKKANGSVDAGYRIDASGELKRDASLSKGKPLKAKLFKDEALQKRFRRVAGAAFSWRYVDGWAVPSNELPNPIAGIGSGFATDYSGDSVKDSVRISTGFSSRLMLDADQNTTAKLPFFVDLKKVDVKSLDPEVAVVSQAGRMWVFYDRNNDGKFDLALHSKRSRQYAAVDAWTLDGNGGRAEASDMIGRMLFRPALLNDKAQQGTLTAMIKRKRLLPIMSADDNDGLASFPDPIADHRGVGYRLVDNKKAPRVVVAISGRGSDGYLMDLDRNSRMGFSKKPKIAKIIADKKFDSEFAYFHRNGLAWAYYDAAGKGTYDTILVATKVYSGKSRVGYRIKKDGTVTLDPKLAGIPLVSPSLFKSPIHKARLKAVSGDLFAKSMREK